MKMNLTYAYIFLILAVGFEVLSNSKKIAKTKNIYACVRFIYSLIYSDKLNF